jgi:DNA-binding beta-propeller fold protein YncE
MTTSRRAASAVIVGATVALLAVMGGGGAGALVAGAGCSLPPVGTTGYNANIADGSVSIVDLTTDHVIGTIGGFNFPFSAQVTPDGRQLFVDDTSPTKLTTDAEVIVDLCTNTIVNRIPTLGLAYSEMSPDGRYIYTTNFTTDGVQQIDTTTDTVVKRFLTTPAAQGATSADGTTMWVTALPNFVYPVNIKTGLPSGLPINVGVVPTQTTISPDGKTLLVQDTFTGDVVLVDTVHHKVAGRVSLGLGTQPSYGAFSPDSKYAWVAYYSGQVAVVDVATHHIVHSLDPGGWVAGATVSPDGSRVYITTTPPGSTIPLLGTAYIAPIFLGQF